MTLECTYGIIYKRNTCNDNFLLLLEKTYIEIFIYKYSNSDININKKSLSFKCIIATPYHMIEFLH